MKRIKQINNIVIYSDRNLYIAKSLSGVYLYSSAYLSEVEFFCNNCTDFLKPKPINGVLLPKKLSDSIDSNLVILHRSSKVIEKPVYGEGEKSNDYGRGFYCVLENDIELAKEWACSRFNPSGTGYVNVYNLRVDGLTCLNLNKYDVADWVSVTMGFRKFFVQVFLMRI